MVVCVLPPPVPVMVMVWVPVLEPAPAVVFIVDVPKPGAAMVAGVKLTLTPDGRPDADSAIAELKLPITVIAYVPAGVSGLVGPVLAPPPPPPSAAITSVSKIARAGAANVVRKS